MKASLRYTLTAVTLAATFSLSAVRAEEKPAPGAMGDPAQMQEMMKKMEELGTPGEAHELLNPLAGEWVVEAKMWMAPDAPPTVSSGSAKADWIMDGRFLREDFTGEMMGKPFHGMAMHGYDNQKKQYNQFWIDDSSTSMFTSLGTASDDGKTITYEGKMDCPMTGEKDMPVKSVLQFVNPDEHILTMYDPRQDNKVKSMEITYKRK